MCKPPVVNLDYLWSKAHILGQQFCWQVWWQNLVVVCFALFCLAGLLAFSLRGFSQITSSCPGKLRGGICPDLASGTGFGSLLNPHGRVKALLLVQCAETSSLALGAF